LGRRHFVVVLFDLGAHARHGAEHFRTHILRGILRRYREVALLDADAVAEVAAFIIGVGVRGQFDRVDLEAGVVRIGLVLDVVEHEELGFRPEIDGVAEAHGFHHAFGFFADAAGIAVVGFAGGRLEHVAHEHQRGLGEERIDAG
jgi:hypothetical protein